MTVNNNIPDLEVFGKGRGDFRLPAGYVDPTGKIYDRIYMREMSGYEDDIMDDDELNVSERITKVIAGCTEKLTTGSPTTAGAPTPAAITDKALIESAIGDSLANGQGLPFTIPDRMAALLYLRRISVGDVYKFERKCPECSKPVKNQEVDLSKLKINFAKDATKRRVKLTLPRSGKEAVLRVLSAAGERRVAELRPTSKDVKSCAILARLESLDGKSMSGGDAQDLDTVKGLPKSDRAHIINVFNAMEGSIETEVEARCKSGLCPSPDFKFDLDLGQVFFSNPEPEIKPESLNWV